MAKVLIVGATRGIGLELAKQYSEAGDDVIACARDVAAAEQLTELADAHDNISVEALDIADPASIEAAAASIGDGAIDTLIIVAGAVGRGVTFVGFFDVGEVGGDVFVVDCNSSIGSEYLFSSNVVTI